MIRITDTAVVFAVLWGSIMFNRNHLLVELLFEVLVLQDPVTAVVLLSD